MPPRDRPSDLRAEASRLVGEVADLIDFLMKQEHVTPTELARRLGIPRPNIYELTGGRRNLTLTELERVFAALGYRPQVTPVDYP